MTMTTAPWGDVATPWNPPSTNLQPDVLDVEAMLTKFAALGGIPKTGAAKLQPNLPDLNTDVGALDIVATIDAYKGTAYSYSGPCPCPSLAVCGAKPCIGLTDCLNDDAFLSCAAGPNNGETCTNHCDCCPEDTGCSPVTGCTPSPGVSTPTCTQRYGMCVKTCTGGDNVGMPCANDTHCPSGTCGQGSCRDRCGRCR